MPQGDESYYTNAATRPQDRYEDYIVQDLVRDVESRFPVMSDRSHRSIAGVSMGGFGAVKLALKYPDIFAFAGGLSSAIDVPSRPFSVKRISQWRVHRAIFGEWQGATQRNNDPFVLVHGANANSAPYFFLTCGDKEGLLPANRAFADLLGQQHLPHEFHVVHGGHDWAQWNQQLDDVFGQLLDRLNTSGDGTSFGVKKN
jgi:S-formylglutathione hydrolase FrmB